MHIHQIVPRRAISNTFKCLNRYHLPHFEPSIRASSWMCFGSQFQSLCQNRYSWALSPPIGGHTSEALAVPLLTKTERGAEDSTATPLAEYESRTPWLSAMRTMSPSFINERATSTPAGNKPPPLFRISKMYLQHLDLSSPYTAPANYDTNAIKRRTMLTMRYRTSPAYMAATGVWAGQTMREYKISTLQWLPMADSW